MDLMKQQFMLCFSEKRRAILMGLWYGSESLVQHTETLFAAIFSLQIDRDFQ